jgi:hypothetical protein
MKIVEAWKTSHNLAGDTTHLTEEEALSYSEHGWVDEGYTIVDENNNVYGFYEDYFDAERKLCELRGGVAIGPDYIAIYDQGEEIAYWHEDEWLQEPELAINLANAVRMYYTKGPALMRELLGK